MVDIKHEPMSGIDSAWDEKWSEWIEYMGGGQPVPDDTVVQLKYQKNSGPLSSNGNIARYYSWGDNPHQGCYAYRYKIKEPVSDMHPDLEWLARNVGEWPATAEVIRRSSDGDEMRYSSGSARLDGFNYFTCSRWQAARQQLGLDQPAPDAFSTPEEEEEEEWETKERSLYGEIKEGFNDMVNHPPHYTQGGIECIEAIRAALTDEEFRGYCKGAALKYIWRERHKGGNESLQKADWYMREAVK